MAPSAAGGPEHIGCTHVRVLIVSAALKRSYFALHTLCNDGSGKLLQARGDRYELVPRKAPPATGRSASPRSGRGIRRKP
jgi:hypothetical protein